MRIFFHRFGDGRRFCRTPHDDPSFSSVHLVLFFLLFFIILNLFFLNLKLLAPSAPAAVSVVNTDLLSLPVSPSAVSSRSTDTPDSVSPSPTAFVLHPTAGNLFLGGTRQTTMKEYFIPLGTGFTKKNTWEDIGGAEAQIDFSLYPDVQDVRFIASLRNPTQNGHVEAQLYNVTDKHPVWGSHITMTGFSQTLTSNSVTLSRGIATYRVQLKSSLEYEIFLDGAKLRIVTRE